MSTVNELEALPPAEQVAVGDTHFVVVMVYDLKTNKQIGRAGTCSTTLNREDICMAAGAAAAMVTFPAKA